MIWKRLPVAVTGLFALLLLLPFLFLLYASITERSADWSYLLKEEFTYSVLRTLFLVVFVNVFAFIWAFVCALGTTLYKIRFHKALHFLSVAPLAFPPYVIGFIFLGSLDSYSFLGGFLTEYLPVWPHLLRSIPVAGLIMSFTLYPYYYLFLRAAFESRACSVLDLGKSLGFSEIKSLFQVLLPMSWPWILGAASLVSFEVASDFSFAYIFNIDTLSVLIYRSWFTFFSFVSAARFALFFTVFVLFFFLYSKRKTEESQFPVWEVQSSRPHLFLGKSFMKSVVKIFLPLFLGVVFFFPFFQLLYWAFESWSVEWSSQYFSIAKHSLLLASAVASVAFVTVLCLVFFVSQKTKKGAGLRGVIEVLLQLSYALPGIIIATGFFFQGQMFFNFIEKSFEDLNRGHFALLTLVLALAVKFMAISFASLAATKKALGKHLQELLKGLSVPFAKKWSVIIWPLCRGAFVGAWFLVFVEVIKEVPVTLMTRPHYLQTFSTRVFELISEGEWQRAAIPSLHLLLLGSLSILWVQYLSRDKRYKHA